MEPVTALIAAAKALTELNNLTKTLGNRVPAPVREQISALYDRVSALQNAVLEKQQQAAELAERCRELEDELGRVKGWETEKDNYDLRQIDGLAFVYVPKPMPPGIDEPEVRHWLCTRCFQDGKKSHLQVHSGRPVLGRREWKCPRCHNIVIVGGRTIPGGSLREA